MPHLFIQLGCFFVDFTFRILNIIPKANNKLALTFVFMQIIVLLIYRCIEDDIRQASALPIQKNITDLMQISLGDSRVEFTEWSIVYFNALFDCPVHLKQHSTCWTGASLWHFAIVTKV